MEPDGNVSIEVVTNDNKKQMKKIIYNIMFCAIAGIVNAQVSIGGKLNVDGASTLLDFNSISSNTNGIILPAVDDTANALNSVTSDNNGTFLFDKSNNRVRMYENSTWVNLSDQGVSSSIVPNASDESNSNSGVIVGAETSNAKGVFILEASDKAMILPKIANPHLTVKSPYPGMLCYDTVGRAIAVFDGNVWSYWK
ncbi:hypothetical protein BXY58_2284 [Epilithonimonas arachidiradicis]|uniref:Uncharacterized protein n=2 Tax=Epilithonimonas arachidiradicis TaxID=1617282 RepID=A0A420D872_9FLAO|nr:hypothetical protein BXY58_2284 [Epilithonimonas arachidiradicis]GGG61429.1 hypothetical protein GCM10007332_24150 [Epilithonimonas arachidiradicis]